MKYIGKLFLFNLITLSPMMAIADPIANESEVVPALSADEIKMIKEKLKQEDYTGILGTGVAGKTVSATGAAFELSPSGTNYYGFWTQTLANGLYYEGRLLTRYNYIAQNPATPGVPVGDENPPMGYGAVIKLGYDFKLKNAVQIVPYVRFNAYKNVSVTYADTDGTNIDSTTIGYFIGSKLAYKVTPFFNPYIDLSGGFQQVNLSGKINNVNASGGTNDQYVFNYEIGFASKVTNSLTIIPSMIYSTTTNNPDSAAMASYANGGFNTSPLTGTSLSYALKLSYGF